MLFSYIKDPRYKNVVIQFVTGVENPLERREYAVGDYIENYNRTEVLLGELKTKQGKWINYWILVRKGQIVGAEKVRSEINKFDVAVKYGLTVENYRKNEKK